MRVTPEPERHDPGGKVKTKLKNDVRGLAHFCGPNDCYRTWLTRTWGPTIDPDDPPPAPLFVGMNPSTADADHNDPTIKREIDFATRWGYQTLCKINIADYRATDPKSLAKVTVPLAAPGWSHGKLKIARQADKVIMAFGKVPPVLLPDARFMVMLFQAADIKMLCFTHNKDQSPRHSLYVKGDARLIPWDADAWLRGTR